VQFADAIHCLSFTFTVTNDVKNAIFRLHFKNLTGVLSVRLLLSRVKIACVCYFALQMYFCDDDMMMMMMILPSVILTLGRTPSL